MSSLTPDLLVDVFSYLRVSEVLSCSTVSRRYRDAATRRDKLWRYMALRDGHSSYVLRHCRRIAAFFDGVCAQMGPEGDSTVLGDALGQAAKAHRLQLSEASAILAPFVEPLLSLELEAQHCLPPYATVRSLPKSTLPDGHQWYHNEGTSDSNRPDRVPSSNDMGKALQHVINGDAEHTFPANPVLLPTPLLPPNVESCAYIMEVVRRASSEAGTLSRHEVDESVHSETACAFLNIYRRFVRLAAPLQSDAEDDVLSVSLSDASSIVRRVMTGKTNAYPYGIHPYWAASTGAVPPNPSWTPFKAMEVVWRTLEDFLIGEAHIYIYCSLLLGGLSNRGILKGIPFRPKMDVGIAALYMGCGGQSVPGSIFTEALLTALTNRSTYNNALTALCVSKLDVKPFTTGSRDSSGLFGHFGSAADASTSLFTMHDAAGLPNSTDGGQLIFTFAATPVHPKSPQFSVALDEIPGFVPAGAVFYSGNPRSPVPAGLTVVAPNIETFMFSFMLDLCQRRRFTLCQAGLINRFPAYGFSSAHLLTTTVSACGIEVTASATPVVLNMYQYMFVYRVSMRLLPTAPYTQVKLLKRHWILRNEDGSIIDEVLGDAVVGDYPVLTRLTPMEYRKNMGIALSEQVEGGGEVESVTGQPDELAYPKEYVYCSRTVFMGQPNAGISRVGAAGLHQRCWMMGGTFSYVAYTDGGADATALEAQRTLTEKPDLDRPHIMVEGKIGDFMCRVGAFEDQLLYGELL